jgi:nicotinamidase-related amidase
MMKPALLMIDIQEIYYDTNPSMQQEMTRAMFEINAIAKAFRHKHLPVIAIYHHDEDSGCEPGAPGFEMHPYLQLEDTDIHIIKTHSSAFIQTHLEETLQKLDVDTLILSGVAAEYCVLATYYGAEHYGFDPIFFAQGVASVNGITSTILSFVEHMTAVPILKMLEQVK